MTWTYDKLYRLESEHRDQASAWESLAVAGWDELSVDGWDGMEVSSIQGGYRITATAEQGAKRARPDIVGTDQPQPVEPFGVGEVWAGRPVMHAPTASLNR